jgi:hypothetical protein
MDGTRDKNNGIERKSTVDKWQMHRQEGRLRRIENNIRAVVGSLLIFAILVFIR